MHEHGKSDSPVVPTKPPDNAVLTAAGAVEGRGLAEGNTASAARPGRSGGQGVPNGLDRVRQVARRDKNARFTALLHHVDLDRLGAAYRAVRPQAARGVDGVMWQAYGQDWRQTSGACTPGCTAGATVRSHRGGRYIPRRAGGYGRWASPRWGTRSPAGRRGGAQRRLRGGLPRLLLRVAARARPA